VKHGDLVNEILLELSPHGLAWSNNTGALKNIEGRLIRYGLPGSSDIIACLKGRFVGIECKVGKDIVRKNQHDFATAVSVAGGIYIAARSVDDAVNPLRMIGLLP
jgi:hypothetical protein